MRSTVKQLFLFPLHATQQRKICSNCLRTINHHLHTSSNKGSHDKTSEALLKTHRMAARHYGRPSRSAGKNE